MTPPRVRALALAREELRSLPRNTFALGALAVVLGIFAPMAAFAYSGEGGITETLIFTWLVGELVVAIVVATRVAAARRSRFVDSLYTTPLEQRTWLAAQAIVGCALAVLVLAMQLPYILVHVAWLGIPAALPTMALAALGMAAFAVALGLFCGVVVGDAGPGAAGGLAGGLAFVTFVLLLLHGLAVTSPPAPMQAVLLRATSLSPLTLVVDGFGIGIFGMDVTDPWRPLVGLGAIVAGLAGAAWVAYVRAQGPLGWEARGARALVVALVALAVIAPVATAETRFVEDDDTGGFAFSPGEHTQIAFVERGAPIHDEAFTLQSIYDSPDLPLDEPVELDALVLLLVPEGTVVRGVRIEVEGSEDVRVEDGGVVSVPDGAPSGRAAPGAGWQLTADVPPRPVYRVPVTLRAVSVGSLADSPALVEVHTRFVADGKAMTSDAKITLDGEIAGATAQLMVAGLPLPLAAAATFVTRKIRTR